MFAGAHSSRRAQQRARRAKQQGLNEGSQSQQPQQESSQQQTDHSVDGEIEQSGSGVQQLLSKQPLSMIAEAPEQTACGWVFHPSDVFEGVGLLSLLKALAALPCVLRLKGVFRCVCFLLLSLMAASLSNYLHRRACNYRASVLSMLAECLWERRRRSGSLSSSSLQGRKPSLKKFVTGE